MDKIVIDKNGKSKEELLKCLEKIEEKYRKEISENNISIRCDNFSYYISASKDFLFLNFWIKATITVNDNEIVLEYDTNAPSGYRNDAVNMIKKMINDSCA